MYVVSYERVLNNFNTSYVVIKLKIESTENGNKSNFNTSYVVIKPDSGRYSLNNTTFQYILCCY